MLEYLHVGKADNGEVSVFYSRDSNRSENMLSYLLVGKADSGEISVFDDRDNFIAGFVEGKWVRDHVFSSYDSEERLKLVQDDQEALRLLSEARAALGCPLEQE